MDMAITQTLKALVMDHGHNTTHIGELMEPTTHTIAGSMVRITTMITVDSDGVDLEQRKVQFQDLQQPISLLAMPLPTPLIRLCKETPITNSHLTDTKQVEATQMDGDGCTPMVMMDGDARSQRILSGGKSCRKILVAKE